MKSVLISIQPKWCELIASGKKTIEVRKTAPRLETPFKSYIYQTKKKWIYRLLEKLGLWQGKVIGEFVCDKIITIGEGDTYRPNLICEKACLTIEEFREYATNSSVYLWHISNLKIYNKPKGLVEFRKTCSSAPTARCYPENCERCPWNAITRPPQNWCYVEDL